MGMKTSKMRYLPHGEINHKELLSIIVIKAFAVWRQRGIQSQKSMYSKYIRTSRMRACTKSHLHSLTPMISKSRSHQSEFQLQKNEGANFTDLNRWHSHDPRTAFTMIRSKIISNTWRDSKVRMRRSFLIPWTALTTLTESLSSCWRQRSYPQYTKGTKRLLRSETSKESIYAQLWLLKGSWRTLKILIPHFSLTLRRGPWGKGNFLSLMSKPFLLVTRYGREENKRRSKTKGKSIITSSTSILR